MGLRRSGEVVVREHRRNGDMSVLAAIGADAS